MDFEFFASLSLEEGADFLDAFLRAERSGVGPMIELVERTGIAANFSVETLPAVIRWAASQIEIVPKVADSSLPNWITSTEGYRRGLFEFSTMSKPLVLRVAYYFGECFVRGFPGLAWSVGDPETALRCMPVVTGFGNRIELSPIFVTENMFRRAVEGNHGDAIDRTVGRWIAYATHRDYKGRQKI